MEITFKQLKAVFTKLKDDITPQLNAAMTEYGITTKNQIAAFLANCGEESSQLTSFEENLKYSKPERLKAVFGSKYFPTIESAKPYIMEPEKLANYVYANKIGNGNTASGEGWKYRGRGVLQVTGKYNYGKAGKALKVDLVSHPELLATPAYAFKSAAHYWKSKNIGPVADADDFRGAVKLINAALIGFDQRKKYYDAFLKVLG